MMNSKLKIKHLTIFIYSLIISFASNAQIGEIIWEDNFNTLNRDIWNADIGNGCEIGLCGWGNAELEYYREENLTIEAIPGEAGNNALVMEAKREGFEGFEFTSGKVTSEGNLSVHYGMIEIRMQTPPVETGLWPAAWLLGTANIVWPAKGEIDMMEMGHRDEEITNQGHPGTNQDNYVGANAIFANEDGSVGSIAYDVGYNKPYVAPTSMANRFMTYRLYWEPTELRLTVIDNGVESDLYEGPLPLSADSVTSAFQKPFFLLMNLAVGGNFTDAAIPGEITASLPSKLYIDYVRVHKWNGFGTVELNYNELAAETGPFGVYTDETPVNNSLSFGLDSEIYVWGETMQDGNTEAYEGNNVIAWETLNPNGWFGGGVASLFGRDMSGYVDDGVLRFNIKVPADLNFRIGVTDNFTNEKWIEFPAGQNNYGLVRNGEWSQVEIPIADFAGLIAFQNMNYLFAISSIDGAFPSNSVQIGIDNIVWDDGNGISTSIDVTGVSITPANVSLEVGETQQLNSTVSPNNATNQAITWNSSNPSVASVSTSGLISALAEGNAEITATTVDGNFSDTTTVSITSETANRESFIPDPNKVYYIDSPIHNLRIAASGSDETPYTTSINTTGNDVEWKFVDRRNGYWQIERVAGGTKPRLRSNNTANADMQPTTSNGDWTYYEFIQGATDGTYFMTLPNGPSDFRRLQVNNAGEIKMVSTTSDGTWESFTFTEVITTETPTTLFIEAENFTAMSGIQLENTADTNGGQNVGFIDTGDWMEYAVNVPTAGAYTLNARVASVPGNAAFQILVNGTVFGTINIGSTEGWQSWTTLSTNINLPAGAQTIRLQSVGDGFNINWFQLENQNASSASAKSIESSSLNAIILYPVPTHDNLTVEIPDFENYSSIEITNMNGQVVTGSNIKSSLTKIPVEHLSKGVYLVKILYNNTLIKSLKFVK